MRVGHKAQNQMQKVCFYDKMNRYIDLVLVGKKDRKYIRNVKVISWELQHSLTFVDLRRKVLKKIVKKERLIRMWKLVQNRTSVRFKRR